MPVNRLSVYTVMRQVHGNHVNDMVLCRTSSQAALVSQLVTSQPVKQLRINFPLSRLYKFCIAMTKCAHTYQLLMLLSFERAPAAENCVGCCYGWCDVDRLFARQPNCCHIISLLFYFCCLPLRTQSFRLPH